MTVSYLDNGGGGCGGGVRILLGRLDHADHLGRVGTRSGREAGVCESKGEDEDEGEQTA